MKITTNSTSNTTTKNNCTTHNTQAHDDDHRAPVAVVRYWALRACIWLHHLDDATPLYNITFERVYRDADGTWKATPALSPTELQHITRVADIAHHKIDTLHRDHERSSSTPTQQNTAVRHSLRKAR